MIKGKKKHSLLFTINVVSGFFQNNAVVDEIHFFDPGFNPFLFAKDILEIDPVLLGTENRKILQNQFFSPFFE
jgi:hypothetical protein